MNKSPAYISPKPIVFFNFAMLNTISVFRQGTASEKEHDELATNSKHETNQEVIDYLKELKL